LLIDCLDYRDYSSREARFITIHRTNKVLLERDAGTEPAKHSKEQQMNITILGAGNMGSALIKQFTRAGHQVRFTSRNFAKANAVAAASPGAIASSPAEALGDSSVVIVATGYADAVPALKSLGSLAGKVVIDITNPLSADFMSLTIGHETSAAEEIAKAVPDAEVVKAFNTCLPRC
jgi:predicted dinucleotide-binding enzyme